MGHEPRHRAMEAMGPGWDPREAPVGEQVLWALKDGAQGGLMCTEPASTRHSAARQRTHKARFRRPVLLCPYPR